MELLSESRQAAGSATPTGGILAQGAPEPFGGSQQTPDRRHPFATSGGVAMLMLFLFLALACGSPALFGLPAALSEPGSISRMTLPAGWIEQTEGGPWFSPVSSRTFHPPETSDAVMSYMQTVLTGDAAGFQRLLDAPLHALKPAEIKFVALEIHANTWVDSDQFHFSSARTETLNGRRVVVLEGQWLDDAGKPFQKDYKLAFLDNERRPRSVGYSAPAALFERYWKQVRQALDSIEWAK